MMKKYINHKSFWFIGLFFFFLGSCSEDTLDEINRDKDNPLEVPLNLLLPVVQTSIAYADVGGDMSLYASVWVQHTTGVHAQLHQADRFVFTNSLVNNTWNSIYSVSLKNLDIIIDQGTEEESWAYVGIAQTLAAYDYSLATDSWGRVPYSESILGAEDRNPAFDSQEFIYTDPENGLLKMLDDAIANMQKESVATPGSDDLLYGGDMALWIKTAYGLKAKFLTRLGNTSYYDPAKILDAASKSFVSNDEAFIFDAFEEGATSEHPWAQEEADRTHLAVSEFLFNLMLDKEDPRAELFFDDGTASVPAPNGLGELDQSGNIYTKIYDYVDPDSPMPFMTYDELKLIEAEAYLRSDEKSEAYTAFQVAVEAAMIRAGLSEDDAEDYITSDIFPTETEFALTNVYQQKYIGFYPFQSIEAYAEWRRTDVPSISNPNGSIPLRFPYPQGEIDNNSENLPPALTTHGVWWDDTSED